MSRTFRPVTAPLFLAAILLAGCQSSRNATTSAAPGTSAAANTPAAPKPNPDGTLASGTGVEKEKPAAGKGNVQGRALYDGKPAKGVEVKLCEKFSQFIGGCSGQMFTAKTGDDGVYVIKNVPPATYEALTVKVFDTPYYVFATSGILDVAKYKVEADKTFFAPDTNLFKSDLKLLSPKAGAKIAAANIPIKWAAYPDAAYYKFSINADSSSGAKTEYDYIDKRVDGLSYELDKPLSPGSYSCKVTAYNANDIRLAESADDIKFTVK
jgi:hypothetical protein